MRRSTVIGVGGVVAVIVATGFIALAIYHGRGPQENPEPYKYGTLGGWLLFVGLVIIFSAAALYDEENKRK